MRDLIAFNSFRSIFLGISEQWSGLHEWRHMAFKRGEVTSVEPGRCSSAIWGARALPWHFVSRQGCVTQVTRTLEASHKMQYKAYESLQVYKKIYKRSENIRNHSLWHRKLHAFVSTEMRWRARQTWRKSPSSAEGTSFPVMSLRNVVVAPKQV
jgi:hypothetical protein